MSGGGLIVDTVPLTMTEPTPEELPCDLDTLRTFEFERVLMQSQ